MDPAYACLVIVDFFVKKSAPKERLVMNVVNNVIVQQWVANVITKPENVSVILVGRDQHVRKFVTKEPMALNADNIANVKMVPLVVLRMVFVSVKMVTWEHYVRKLVPTVSMEIIA